MSKRRRVPEVLNPMGELILVPEWLVRQLDKMKMLYWNRDAKRYQISPNIYVLLSMSATMSGFVHRPLRAQQLNGAGGRAKDSGYVNPILRALGPDCTGLNVSYDKTRQLEEELQEEPLTPVMRELRAELVVKRVKTQTRFKPTRGT